jgi:formiminotetrahydrofolate cyclodeaminase
MSARAAAGRLRSADRTAARGDELRARALRLAGEDALAYADVLKTQRMPEGEERDRALATALSAAAGAPLEIAEIAAEIADAAAGLAGEGVPALRGEALTALWLAESGARAATELVRIDVRAAGRARGRLADAERALARARDAVRRATARGDSAST